MLTQAESPVISPEEVLRELDLQRARHHLARAQSGPRRSLFLMGALGILTLGAGALVLLFSLVHDLPRPEGKAAEMPVAQHS